MQPSRSYGVNLLQDALGSALLRLSELLLTASEKAREAARFVWGLEWRQKRKP